MRECRQRWGLNGKTRGKRNIQTLIDKPPGALGSILKYYANKIGLRGILLLKKVLDYDDWMDRYTEEDLKHLFGSQDDDEEDEDDDDGELFTEMNASGSGEEFSSDDEDMNTGIQEAEDKLEMTDVSENLQWNEIIRQMYLNPDTYIKYEDFLNKVLRDDKMFTGNFTLENMNLIKHPGLLRPREDNEEEAMILSIGEEGLPSLLLPTVSHRGMLHAGKSYQLPVGETSIS